MTQHSDTNQKTARRVFANEFNDGLHTFTESDEDKAPVYQLLPTGQRANRVFAVGTYTETEDKTDNYVRARVVDPTGTFMLYAGQYQIDAKAEIESLTPPTYVAIVGKPNVYTPDDEDQTYASLKPESITVVDEAVRNAWVKETASLTIDRIDAFDPQENKYANMASNQFPESGIDYRDSIVSAIAELEGGSPTEGRDSTPDETAQTA